MEVSATFKQLTDNEIKQLKRLKLASRLLELSEEDKAVKNNEVYHLSSYEAREIVEQLDNKLFEKLYDINFCIGELVINENKVDFVIDEWIYYQNFRVNFKEVDRID